MDGAPHNGGGASVSDAGDSVPFVHLVLDVTGMVDRTLSGEQLHDLVGFVVVMAGVWDGGRS